MPAHSLVADIGGTNTRVALAEGGALVPASIRHYRNEDFDALEPVLHQFIEETGGETPRAACLAMAGPVREGVGELTNLDWRLDTQTLAAATGAKTVSLLNDLQAQGHALGHLNSDALFPVIAGKPPHLKAAQMVVGVGTGFNAAPVFNTIGGRFVPPSECGHTTLPVRSPEDLRLSLFVTRDHGFPAIEDVLSGRGLEHIHAWHCEESGTPGGAKSREIMSDFASGDPVATAAVTSFSRLLGAVCGDLSLTNLPFGGVFLIGGMARAVAPHLVELGFVEAFRDKGRFGDFMGQFAVTVVSDDDAALIGSANHLQGLLTQG